jgi:transposase
MMPADPAHVIVGVDTHADSHTAVVINTAGRRLAEIEIATTADGYRELLEWACAHGEVFAFGVEGTSAYGAGLVRLLREHDVVVVEVNRPNRQHRRRHGKSDPADAFAAARAVLAGEATAVAKVSTGLVEAVRVLHLARRSALKAKTQAGNQIKDLIITAADPLRDELRTLKTPARVRIAATWEPTDVADTTSATRYAIGSLARRWTELHNEIKRLEKLILPLLRQLVPTLLAERGVGLDVAAKLVIAAGENPERLNSEAAFAALCGTSPVDASTGKQHRRHRLNRGGNRQANNALHTVVLYRANHHSETRAYIERRRAEQLSDREIWRCLKRALARRFHHLLVHDLANSPLT